MKYCPIHGEQADDLFECPICQSTLKGPEVQEQPAEEKEGSVEPAGSVDETKAGEAAEATQEGENAK